MKQKHFIVAFLAMLMCFASPTFAQVAKIGDTEYATLTKAIEAADAGQTITLAADVNESVTIGKSLTIDGAGYNYTGAMTLKADATIKNVNFDGKGYKGYAIETRGANYLTIEDCTAKNYGYGFVQLASATALTTVKNVTVSNMNYGVKVDYSNAVVIESSNITASVAAVLNSNYGEKPITIKNSKLNILGTWTRNNTLKTNYVFEGSNSIDKFIIDAAIDNFQLAAGATLTAPNEITVSTVEDYEVEYNNGKFASVEVSDNVAMIGEQGYKTLTDALTAATAGQTITLVADVTEDVTISKAVTIDGAGKTYTGNMTLTSKANITIKNVNFDGKGYNGYAVESKGAYNVTIEDCTAKNYGYGFVQLANGNDKTTVKNVTVSGVNYGVKVDYSNAVVIENANITAGVAAVLNSNYGEKPITIKNSKLNILGTWKRNNTLKTNYVFEGSNTIDSFIIEAAIDNFKLAAGATLTAPNEITVTTVENYEVKYENGTYTSVEVSDNVAMIGEQGYETLADAIAAATAGQTITLAADVNENVKINKSLTIDGAGNNYTGKMTTSGTANYTVTVKNVNFVEGTFAKPKNTGTNGTYTFDNCTFDGNGMDAYAIDLRGTSSIVIKNVTATNYRYGLLQVPSSCAGLTIKNVEVSNCYYGFKVDYANSVSMENVAIADDVTIGIYDSNYGTKTYTIKNSTLNAMTPIKIWERNQTNYTTFKFLDVNTVASLPTSNFAKIDAGAQIGTTIYQNAANAIEAVQPGNTLTLFSDVTIANSLNAAGLTIEGNGKTLTYTGSGASARAITVESGAKGANLTINNLIVDCTASYCQRGINYNTTGALTLDNVTVKGKNVTYALNLPGSSVGANVTINKSSLTGNIALNVWGKESVVNAEATNFTSVDNNTAEGYSAIVLNNDGTTAAEGAIVNINGGTITAKDENGNNASAVRNATATGQVNVSDATTVVGNYSYPVAIVTYGSDQFYSCATLQAAIDKAIETKGAVKLIDNVTASEIIVVNAPVVIDGNGKKLTSTAARAINVVTEGEVTIENLTVNASGERAFNVITKPGTLNIQNVTATAANYTVNVATSAGAAKVNVSGSTLTGLNVVNVAAEGANVTVADSKLICDDQNKNESYAALALNKAAKNATIAATNVKFDIKDNSVKASNGAEGGKITIDGVDASKVVVAVIEYEDTDNYYSFETLAAAVAKAEAGETVKLLRDATGAGVVIDKDITIDFNGKTYTVNEGVGSTGTETLGLQILKGNNVTLKNGTLTSEGDKVKMLINNYTNLIVDNMKLVDATDAIQYVLSNNSGNVVIKNNSEITANGAIALDACKYASYELPVVTVKEGVKVTGDVEVSATLNMNGTLNGSIILNGNNGVVNTTKEYNVTTNVANSKVVLNNGAYTVEAVNYVAKVGEQGYETLAAALAAATAGQTITLAADVTEDVTISKAVTIDGDNKTYTGKMTVGNFAVTIENVNFVKGSIDANVSGSARKLTVKNCAFDGVDKSIGYAITQRHGASVVIENSSAKNYSTGMLYIPQNVATIIVKDVTVENVAAAFNISYSGDGLFENVKLNNVRYGLHVQNHGARTFTMKNWKSNGGDLTYVQNKGTAMVTFKFDGKIELGEGQLHNSQYAIYKNAAVVDGNESVIYGSLTDALADGSEVKLLTDFVAEGAVINKNATIDFNGKTYTVNKTVGSTGTTTLGLQILKGNDVVLKNGTLNSTAVTEGKEVKMLVQNYANLTVENMNLDDETEHILYVLSNNSGNVVVKGNTNITTDAVAFDACKYANYAVPTVTVETTGKIAGAIEVTGGNLAIKGGTYTVNVADWCDSSYICKANADRTFSVIYNPTINNVAKIGDNYYPTLRAAVDAAPAGATVELIKDVVLEGGNEKDAEAGLVIDKELILDGKEHTINCGTFVKGIRIYNPIYPNKWRATFQNVTIVNDNANGRCIDTRNGAINLSVLKSSLIATNGNSQPLTIGGSEAINSVTLSNHVTIDAGNSGYAVINFVPAKQFISTAGACEISGYAAFYCKADDTRFNLTNTKITGKNVHSGETNGFGAIVLEGNNNTVNLLSRTDAIAITEGGAEQAAILVCGNNNTITMEEKYSGKTNISAEVNTQGENAYWTMVNAEATGNSIVKYGENVELVAEANGCQFISLDDALRYAKNGGEVKLLADVTLDTKNVVTDCDGYASIINVEGKALTFDLNGKAMTVNANAADLADAKNKMLLAVFSTDEGGNLTLTDSSEDKTGSVTVRANDATVYSVVANYTNGCYVTINGGNYYADKLYDSMVYTGANETVVVNGGKFILGNVGTGANGKPWIFNALGQNERHVTVNGGTFNADVLHQYWVFEVNADKEKALKHNEEDGTWTMVEAVAYVTEKHGKYNNYVGYATIEEAIACNNKADNTVTLAKNVEISNMITVAKDETLVLDLNGKTIAATDNTTKNYSAIDNRGNLTITGDGKITVKATENSGWNRYSAVIANNPGGNLTVENGTIEHLGGTDMAYGIDNLTNGKGTYAETTINGGLVKSPYRAVRQFLNGVEAQNILTVNGGTLEGANKSIFFHDPSNKANSGTLYVAENATLNGDVYLFVTAGSTEWPVEVEIAKEALGTSKVLSANVPANYAVTEYPAYWTVESLKVAELTIKDNCEEYININEITVDTLTYERYFENANEWQTIYLPFDVPAAKSNLMKEFDVAYIYNAAYKDGSLTIDFVEVKDEEFVLAANYPYLIRAKEAGNNEIVVEGAKLMPTAVETIDCSSVFETFSFIGNYSTIAAPQNGNRYVVLTDGAWVSMNELNPFRFYLQIKKRDGSSFVDMQSIRMRSVDMNGIENATGVESVDAEQNVDYIFDVHGRRVVEPQKGGIYIINGVKVIF